MRRNLVWKLLGLVISVSIAVYLLLEIDLDSFLGMVRRVPVWGLVAALAIYLLLNAFRTLRFRALLDHAAVPLATLYPIVVYHNLLVRVLPFKTGEVSYVVLLRQHLNQPLREGVSSLVSARLFELLVIMLAGGLSLSLTADAFADEAITLSRETLVPLVFTGLVLYLVALYFSGDLLRLIAQPVSRLPLGHWQTTMAEKIMALAASFDRIRQPRVFFTTFILSTLTYSMSVSFNLVLLRALGIEVNPGLLVGVISIVMLAEALPLATISGLGMIEGGWTFGLVAFAGFELGGAASIGFFLHGCQLLAALLTGLAGYAWLQINRDVKQQVGLEA